MKIEEIVPQPVENTYVLTMSKDEVENLGNLLALVTAPDVKLSSADNGGRFVIKADAKDMFTGMSATISKYDDSSYSDTFWIDEEW